MPCALCVRGSDSGRHWRELVGTVARGDSSTGPSDSAAPVEMYVGKLSGGTELVAIAVNLNSDGTKRVRNVDVESRRHCCRRCRTRSKLQADIQSVSRPRSRCSRPPFQSI